MFSPLKNKPTEETIVSETNQSNTQEKKENTIVEIIRFSVIALLIVVPVRMFIAQPFIVSGASMQDTFHTGEYLIVDQLSYHFNNPHRGDVIVFRYPKDPSKFFIKRVIGLPGETVDIKDSVVTIYNEKHPEGLILDEPYIKSMTPTKELEEKLGDREYFVMGDNRDESSDSRIWGVLTEERIIGRAFLRLFPLKAVSFLPGFFDSDANSKKVIN